MYKEKMKTIKELEEEMKNNLSKDVEEFLKKGGVIKQIPYGASVKNDYADFEDDEIDDLGFQLGSPTPIRELHGDNDE